LLLCSRDSRCAAEIPKINQHEDRGSGAVRRIREHPGLRATIGVNFIDIYHRIGLYPLPNLPVVIGVEAPARSRLLVQA
jgi:hypothetical protein